MFDFTGGATLISSHIEDSRVHGMRVYPMGVRKVANGTIFTNNKLGIKAKFTGHQKGHHRPVILAMYQNIHDTEIRGSVHITDSVISERIIEYISNYFGKSITNCSTLARFLYSGDYTECSFERHSFMFNERMVPYNDQKIEVGDVLCVLYNRTDRLPKSRFSPFRKHYRKALLSKDVLIKNDYVKRVLSQENISEIYESGLVKDYHFLTCIANYGGHKIFAQQMGFHNPFKDDIEESPIVFSFGAIGYVDLVPLVTYIRKRRK